MSNGIAFDGLVEENHYLTAINLTYKTILNNLCLRLYYPKWDGKDESIKTNSGMIEDEIVQTHLMQISDLKKVMDKLNYFEKDKYTHIKPEIEKEARLDFKDALENELASLYKEYKNQFNPDVPWNYAVVNRYMETYDKIFGREALMQVPAVRSFKKDYDTQMNKGVVLPELKNRPKTTENGMEKGLLSKFAQSSNNVVDENKQETDLPFKRIEVSSTI